MTRVRLSRCLLWAFVVAGIVIAAAAQNPADAPSPAEPFKVMFPADQSVLESGKFDVVCVMHPVDGKLPPRPELRVNGVLRNWGPYKEPTLLTRVQLPPGRHEITIGPRTLRIYVRDEKKPDEAPDGWPVFRTHRGATEPWKNCSTCHELTRERGSTVIGALMEPAACAKCHSPEAFELAHFHPEEPLAACHDCHALHGSANKALLKGPIKQLCAECHD